MAKLNEREANAEIAALRRRLRDVEGQAAQLAAKAFLVDGTKPIAGPLQHAGSTLGFFNIAPQTRPSVAPVTLDDVIIVLQRYGLVP
jgi:hypothetical protein